MVIVCNSIWREKNKEINTLRADIEHMEAEILTARKLFQILRKSIASGKLTKEEIDTRLSGFELSLDSLVETVENVYGMNS